MVAPSRARRLPASRSIRARSPRCTNAVFSFSPVNLRASASKSSSMFNVVLIHIMMHVSYAHCKNFVSHVGFRAPPKQSFLLFCWPAREMGELPRPCRLALRVTAKQLLAAPILALRDITRFLVSRILRDSVRFFLAEFLKARIVADLIPDRVESQQRRSNGTPIRYLQQPLEDGYRVMGIPQACGDRRYVVL